MGSNFTMRLLLLIVSGQRRRGWGSASVLIGIGWWCTIWLCFVLFTVEANDGNPTLDNGVLPSPSTPSCQCIDMDENDVESFVAYDDETVGNIGDKGDDGGRKPRLAYLITVHNRVTTSDALHLFRAVRGPGITILVHVDTKMELHQFQASELHREIADCPCGSDYVHWFSIHDAKWSTWSMNEPTLWAMNMLTRAAELAGNWDVFINLSGDSLPVLAAGRMRQVFQSLKGINFMTSSACTTGLVPTNVYKFPAWWHKRGHYTTNQDGSKNPILTFQSEEGSAFATVELEIHFGSQWMALEYDLVKYVVDELDRPDSMASQLKDWLLRNEKLMTDETFFPTLILHTPFWNETLPKVDEDGRLQVASYPSDLPPIRHMRFERMDEHVPTAFGEVWLNQRYEVTKSSKASSPKPWGPYFLGVYDLAAIVDSGSLWVRKISTEVDPNLVRLLPVDSHFDLPYIEWPHEVAVSEKVDWKAWYREAMKDIEKEKEEPSADEEVEEF